MSTLINPALNATPDDEVVEALKNLGGSATALALCNALVSKGHPRPDSQLAIQRSAERGKIAVGADWQLSLPANTKVVQFTVQCVDSKLYPGVRS